jgi:hypothetical protein
MRGTSTGARRHVVVRAVQGPKERALEVLRRRRVVLGVERHFLDPVGPFLGDRAEADRAERLRDGEQLLVIEAQIAGDQHAALLQQVADLAGVRAVQ